MLLAGLVGDNEDLNQSVLCYQNTALSATGSPRLKLQAARQWARICDNYSTGCSLDAYRHAMALLPQIVWLGSLPEDRYNNIADVDNISREAVAAAIAQQDFESALEWSEQGHSIVWRQMLQLRTPVDDLATMNPALAAELRQVAHNLDHGNSRTSNCSTGSSDEHSLEDAARRHRRLAEKWERLIVKARRLPGLDGFLRPIQAAELVRSAHSGAVVMFSLHNNRSDALIMTPGGAEISHVPLPRFSFKKATDISAQLSNLLLDLRLINRGIRPMSHTNKVSFEPVLAVLWVDVVKPVLDFLGYTVRASLLFILTYPSRAVSA